MRGGIPMIKAIIIIAVLIGVFDYLLLLGASKCERGRRERGRKDL